MDLLPMLTYHHLKLTGFDLFGLASFRSAIIIFNLFGYDFRTKKNIIPSLLDNCFALSYDFGAFGIIVQIYLS